MPLSRVQLMTPPGGPGNFGAIKAGDNVTINETTGAVTTPPGGVGKVLGGGGITVNPPEGRGMAITLALPVPSVKPFTSGTTILVMNSSAPLGYTKSTGFDNYALRVTSGAGAGTGGSVDFSSVFTNITPTGSFSPPSVNLGGDTSQSAWTPTGQVTQGQLTSVQASSITRGQNNSHSHQYNLGVPGSQQTDWRLEMGYGDSQTSSPVGTTNVGNGDSHQHNLSFSVGWSGSPLNHQHSWSSSAGGGGGTFTGQTLGLGEIGRAHV